jgi:hypothetical protein
MCVVLAAAGMKKAPKRQKIKRAANALLAIVPAIEPAYCDMTELQVTTPSLSPTIHI